jgi:hypothetical protein
MKITIIKSGVEADNTSPIRIARVSMLPISQSMNRIVQTFFDHSQSPHFNGIGDVVLSKSRRKATEEEEEEQRYEETRDMMGRKHIERGGNRGDPRKKRNLERERV